MQLGLSIVSHHGWNKKTKSYVKLNKKMVFDEQSENFRDGQIKKIYYGISDDGVCDNDLSDDSVCEWLVGNPAEISFSRQ